MSKYATAFSNFGGSSEKDSDFVKRDWNKTNSERADVFDTKDKAKARVGVISGISDLGVQPVEDGKKPSTLTPEQEAEWIKNNPTNYFEDVYDAQTKKTVRCVRWPQKPQRAIAITVDFPQYQYDWGDDIGVKPFRFLLNGEFIHKGMKRSDIVVGRTYDLKETTKDFEPKWSLAKNSLPYKLALATNVIKADEPFTKKQLGELIGKAALFEVRFWVEDGYANEKISFKSEVPEGMTIPTINENLLYYINLDTENDETHVKQLRKAVKNTIKKSVSYPGSKLQQQWGKYFEDTAKSSNVSDEAPEAPQIPAETPVEESSPAMFDESSPF